MSCWHFVQRGGKERQGFSVLLWEVRGSELASRQRVGVAQASGAPRTSLFARARTPRQTSTAMSSRGGCVPCPGKRRRHREGFQKRLFRMGAVALSDRSWIQQFGITTFSRACKLFGGKNAGCLQRVALTRCVPEFACWAAVFLVCLGRCKCSTARLRTGARTEGGGATSVLMRSRSAFLF